VTPSGKVSGERNEDEAPRLNRVFKVDRLDKIVALVVGAALVLAVVWVLFQFFLGFCRGYSEPSCARETIFFLPN
jgi:hypothetical protein